MTDSHERFHDWLTGGADGEPARDTAVHASVCAGCRRSIDALDRLAMANTGLAGMPADPIGRERGGIAIAGRLVGATAVLFSAAILGVGVSQLIGVSPGGGPVAHASPTPDQSVLAETATPGSPGALASQSASPGATLTPLGPPSPTHGPAVTPIPGRTLAPTPVPTLVATPMPSGTPFETAVPTPIPTPLPTPTPTPVPTPAPPVDTDGDGVTDVDEVTYGSDPNDNLSTPENSLYAAPTCTDGVDNDLDTLTDIDDPGCP